MAAYSFTYLHTNTDNLVAKIPLIELPLLHLVSNVHSGLHIWNSSSYIKIACKIPTYVFWCASFLGNIIFWKPLNFISILFNTLILVLSIKIQANFISKALTFFKNEIKCRYLSGLWICPFLILHFMSVTVENEEFVRWQWTTPTTIFEVRRLELLIL